ncbi:hypothetical protein ACOSQ4_022689 [Xanthoceras sorbifolium]
MSSSSDQERHEVHIDGPPDAGDRKSRPFDEVVVEYEWFASRLKAMKRGDKTTMTSRSEMIGSSTSGHVEVRRDQREPAEAGDFSFPSFVIKREDLVDLTHTFHFSMGHRVLIPRASDRPAYPSPSYVAISSHHLIVGLRFHLPTFLKRVLNLLELAPMQLTPNAYTQLLSFYLIFSRKGIGSLTDNIIRHCFLLKNCPFLRNRLVKLSMIGYTISLCGQVITESCCSRILSPMKGTIEWPTFILRAPKSSPSNINVSFCHLVS